MTVEIGTAIISYIEPHPGQEVAFNRWYELDHFPATVKAGPGVFAAARFVATRSCKALRPVAGRLFGDPAHGSYLGVAWVLPGKQQEWDEWVGREMDTIAEQGRLFPGRDHVHTAVYECIWHADDVDAIVGLDRGLSGAIVVADVGAAPHLDLPVADRAPARPDDCLAGRSPAARAGTRLLHRRSPRRVRGRLAAARRIRLREPVPRDDSRNRYLRRRTLTCRRTLT